MVYDEKRKCVIIRGSVCDGQRESITIRESLRGVCDKNKESVIKVGAYFKVDY